MRKIILILLLFFLSCSIAQSQDSVSITVNWGKGNSLVAVNISNNVISLSGVHTLGSLTIKASINRGYYYLNGDLIYIEPGINIILGANYHDTEFKGNGLTENAILKTIQSLQITYLPVKLFDNIPLKLKDDAGYIEPKDFIRIIKIYKAKALSILAEHRVDPFFRKTQKQYINCIIGYYTGQYMSKYGVDTVKLKEFVRLSWKLNQGSIKPNDPKLKNVLDSLHAKKFTPAMSKRLKKIRWSDFDINNDALYQYCQMYRTLVFEKLFMLLTEDKNYKSDIKLEPTSFDNVQKYIKNNYIKQELFFQYAQTKLAYNEDAAFNYYRYMSLANNQEHINKIRERYYNSMKKSPGIPHL